MPVILAAGTARAMRVLPYAAVPRGEFLKT
jgi:hypothetical protein